MSICEKLKKPFTKKYRWQYFSCGSAAAGGLCIGATLGWAGPSIGEILILGEHGNSISSSNVSWIVSFPLLGSSLGSILGYLLNLKIGPRRTILSFAFLFAISWFLMRYLLNVDALMVSRFTAGISTGAFFIVIPRYMREVAEKSLRQKFYTIFGHQVVGGIFFSYIHALMGWKKMSLIGGLIGLQLFISMYFMPDSPKYLFASGKTEEGIEALKKLRGAKFEEIVPEFHELLKRQNEKLKEPKFSISSMVDSTLFLKQMSLSLFFIVFQHLTGSYAFIFYPIRIFGQGNIHFNPVISMILFGIAIVIGGTLFGALKFNLNPQKKFFLTFGILIQAFLFLSGIIMYPELEKILNVYALLVCKILFPSLVIFFYFFGMEGNVLSLHKHLIEENSLKEPGESILIAIHWLCAFLVVKIYPVISELLGVFGTFWFFGLLTIAGVIGSVYLYPEFSTNDLHVSKPDFELTPSDSANVEIKKIGDEDTHL